MTKLFYAGPPLRVLHEEYAKRGRIDPDAPLAVALLDDSGSGGTHLRCEESMAGPLLALIYSEAKLRAAVETWLNALKTAAER